MQRLNVERLNVERLDTQRWPGSILVMKQVCKLRLTYLPTDFGHFKNAIELFYRRAAQVAGG